MIVQTKSHLDMARLIRKYLHQIMVDWVVDASPRAPEVDGSSEAGTFFRATIGFGGGCDMISGRGQFNNGGGPLLSTSELRKC